MSEVDNSKVKFQSKLDKQISSSQARMSADLDRLRKAMRGEKAAIPGNLPAYLTNLSGALTERLVETPKSGPRLQFQVEIGGSTPLQQLDSDFLSAFRLADYFPPEWIAYPTVYCETLEEFFTPLTLDLDISPHRWEKYLDQWMREAQNGARKIFGFNLPGIGCFLNGWLFGTANNLSAGEAFQNLEILNKIIEIAAHEKLGHGFLSAFSELGRSNSVLGLRGVELARLFGIRPADDPTSSLREAQHDLIFDVSQLLEEGWATWVETFVNRTRLAESESKTIYPRHSLAAIVEAVQNLEQEDLPPGYSEQQVKERLFSSLAVLLGPIDANPYDLQLAVQVIERWSGLPVKIAGAAYSQPLRYAIGELLFAQAELNQGAFCLPYLALIAGNVNFKLESTSLADVTIVLQKDPRLHPDARLAALCRLRLHERGSLTELVQRAESELSFSVPPELKNGLKSVNEERR